MTAVSVTDAGAGDIALLADAFRAWPKPSLLFETYRASQLSGQIDLLVARVGTQLVGYCLIEWVSEYPPFRAAGIPEISDLNVLCEHRGLGAGRELLAVAEQRVTPRSDVVGLRVGLYVDYGRAQQLYARRGYVPDGRGLTVDGQPVPPGATIILDDGPVLALTRHLPARGIPR